MNGASAAHKLSTFLTKLHQRPRTLIQIATRLASSQQKQTIQDCHIFALKLDSVLIHESLC